MYIPKEALDKMPTKEEFYTRLKRLGVVDENGNVDESRLDELGDLPQSELN